MILGQTIQSPHSTSKRGDGDRNSTAFSSDGNSTTGLEVADHGHGSSETSSDLRDCTGASWLYSVETSDASICFLALFCFHQKIRAPITKRPTTGPAAAAAIHAFEPGDGDSVESELSVGCDAPPEMDIPGLAVFAGPSLEVPS